MLRTDKMIKKYKSENSHITKKVDRNVSGQSRVRDV